MKKTIVFDFDGVIHKYSKGWNDGSIYDVPVDGIYELLGKLRIKGYRVVIVSTRCASEEGMNELKTWLINYGLNGLIDEVSATKPPAMVYIDDRAICFDGNAIDGLLYKIENFHTWQENTNIK